ncbi:unnamed protein product [Linum trigynum]|uniref:Uncharacterized protein n=1 Tax=Linum trigynum TaxID=586398 RepID=A0AAV2ESJ8_9ROSI
MELFKAALPTRDTLPTSFYEVKRYMQDLGFGYTIIDACPNNCVLFKGPLQSEKECPKCQHPRYNPGKRDEVAIKKARYFPIKGRLQRLFMMKSIAKDMRWHNDKCVDDDVLRHSADGVSWKSFDRYHSWFASDPRNV